MENKMKYTINGFQQSDLINSELDLIDSELLKLFLNFESTGEFDYKVVDEKVYLWISQTFIIEYVPFLVSSKATLQRRLNKMEKHGYIKRHLSKKKSGQKGNYSYIHITKKTRDMMELTLKFQEYKKSENNQETLENTETDPYLKDETRGYLKDEIRVTSNVRQGLPQERGNKDSLKDNSLKDDSLSFIQEKEGMKEDINSTIDSNERKELQEIIDNSYSKDFKEKDTIDHAIKMLYYTDKFLKIDNMNVPAYEVRQNLEKIDYSILEAALYDYKKAAKEQKIKYPVKYFSKCLYHSIINSDFKITSEVVSDGVIQ